MLRELCRVFKNSIGGSCWVAEWSKAKLFAGKDIIFTNELVEVIVHNTLKNLGNYTEKGYWSI